jgi:membrane-associated phospholipid phosphatase
VQLEIIQRLQQIQTPFLDQLIKLLDFFDRQEFVFVLIPILWLGLNWRFGLKMFYLLSLSHLVNYGLKNFFALPRPFHLDPSLGVIQVSGYGFPSGAAQTALLLSGILIIHWKSHWKWVVAAVYTLSISFSRLYLGVHFPLDILGGWAIGLGLLCIYLFLFPKIENFFHKRSPLNALLFSQLVPLALMVSLPSKTVITVCACAMGLGEVFIMEMGHTTLLAARSWQERLLRIFIGIAGVFAVFHLFSPLGLFLQFFAIGIWMSLVSFAICKQLARCLPKN